MRKPRPRAAELRQLEFIGAQLQRIAAALERLPEVVVSGSHDRVNVVGSVGTDAVVGQGDNAPILRGVQMNSGGNSQMGDYNTINNAKNAARIIGNADNSPILDNSTLLSAAGNGVNNNHSAVIGATHGTTQTTIGNYDQPQQAHEISHVEGDNVTTNGVGSPGKVGGNVHFDAKIDQAIGKADGDVNHDLTKCENHAAGGYAVDTIQNVDQRSNNTESFNTNSGDAIKSLTTALQHKTTLKQTD